MVEGSKNSLPEKRWMTSFYAEVREILFQVATILGRVAETVLRHDHMTLGERWDSKQMGDVRKCGRFKDVDGMHGQGASHVNPAGTRDARSVTNCAHGQSM